MSQKMTDALWAQLQHFKPTEFDRPEWLEFDLMQRLDKARIAAGIPLVVARGAVRTPSHNLDVGGANNSAHLRGYAVDIQVSGSRARYLVLKGLLAAGFTRIGDRYPSHIHADCDPSLPQEVAW